MITRELLERTLARQQEYAQKYGLPDPVNQTDEEAFWIVNEFLCHMIEEVIEARVYVPRKFWKKKEKSYLDSPELTKEFCYEMCDILLFYLAVLVNSKIDFDTIIEAFEEKVDYNGKRNDHHANLG